MPPVQNFTEIFPILVRNRTVATAVIAGKESTHAFFSSSLTASYNWLGESIRQSQYSLELAGLTKTFPTQLWQGMKAPPAIYDKCQILLLSFTHWIYVAHSYLWRRTDWNREALINQSFRARQLCGIV